MENSHYRPAAHADNNHEKPARDYSKAVNDVAQRHKKAIFSEPAICRVECALIGGSVLVVLLGMDLVDCLRGDCGRVHVDDVQRSRWALLGGLSLWNLEVPDGWSTSGPGGTEKLV